ncbi:MAG TPA: NAD-dependent epimerase/dehydratase family protein [Candidatus Eisenbacteria bacterium]|nr:NAD-dependent epimerase/dehydratase family protein [Candidatus Eisenbacteria bacterium]
MRQSRASLRAHIKKLHGPILILGSGGFIGVNLLKTLLTYRKDVFGVSRNKKKNWRFRLAKIPTKNIIDSDITNTKDIEKIFKKVKPLTVFNLAAYGAYAKQSDYKEIYKTNALSTVNILEELKKIPFKAYIHAGSQSEYGLNAKGPKETGELIPNSHYAVSKVGNYYLLKYYGKVEHLPVVHLRLYSAYGPWEEPDRLMPVLVSKAIHKTLPNFVDPKISRDFIYIDDVVSAFVISAAKMQKRMYGEVFNVATGKKTKIKTLAFMVKKMFEISENPQFSTMKNRNWDIIDWFGNNAKIKRILGWRPEYSLKEGLELTVAWQEEIHYDKLSIK